MSVAMVAWAALSVIDSVSAWPRPVPLVLRPPPAVGPLAAWVGVGDVDGDGREDLLTGAPRSIDGPTDVGWVGLWRGGSWPEQGWQKRGLPGQEIGVTFAAAGDVNGDAFADVAIAISSEGEDRVEVYLGGQDGLGDEPAWVDGRPIGSRYGADIDGLGDLDGDGRAELAIVDFAGGTGWVRVHRGSSSGLESRVWFEVPGTEVAWAGDLDGDGRSELAVGDSEGVRIYRVDPHQESANVAPELWAELSPGPFSGVGDLDADGFMDLALVRDGVIHVVRGGPEPRQIATTLLAESAASAGDMNGDGHADLVVARGDVVAFVAGGQLQEPARVREVASLTLAGGSAARAPLGLGDIDGDGFGDVAVGRGGAIYIVRGVGTGLGTEPLRLSTPQRGASAAAALQRPDAFALDGADLNGDGFSDVVLGSRWAGGGAGRVDVFMGGAPPSRQSSWSVEGAAGDALGASVSAGGDADGDGFEDAWLGAPDARNGAFVSAGYVEFVRGGTAGPARVRHYPGGEGNSFGLLIGRSADLDLDGRAEVAFLFSGSPASILVIFADPRGPTRLAIGNLPDYPRQRAVVGDIDGDGRDELVVGYETRRVLRFERGELRGVDTWPPPLRNIVASAGDADGDGDIELIETLMAPLCALQQPLISKLGVVSGGANDRFGPTVILHEAASCPGWSVDSAGDVDGDGLGDLIIGAPLADDGDKLRAGHVYLHRGTPIGFETSPSWTLAGDLANRYLGTAVASAGDVDGDGFSDIVVAGVPVATTEADDVLVQVYRGNGGHGTTSAWHYAVSARQHNVVAPLPVGGRTILPHTFAVRATAGSAYGRRVALEVEVKPHGAPFDGQGLIRSDGYVEVGSTLVAKVDGLMVDTAYKWRARLSTHPAHGPRQTASHWLYGGHPGESQGVHLRTRINRPPISKPFSATLTGSPFLRLPPGVLGGATDPDGDPLEARLGRPPAHGKVEIAKSGAITYTPDPGFSGVERFTYVASDGLGGEVEAPIELTVPGPDGCGLISDAACLRGDLFLVVHLEDGRLASIRCHVGESGAPFCDTDPNGELRLGEPSCGY